ncbi:prolactin receptor [Brachyhypopomus gauderio]|uniref:prolactin receptor n=1 Tax=Brachyhypopomus gauderio TaxID=698409 RepID=UPI00404273B1
MLQLVFFLLCWSTISVTSQESPRPSTCKQDASKPYIHYCRSPDMETFTCWWRPLDGGLQDDDNITYSFMYSIGKRALKECPDYVSGGENSCYFDHAHTFVWELYCMNLTAHSLKGSITSEECCLDVADFVETDPPFNLTYTLLDINNREPGRTVHVSWQYPIASQIQTGWITLVYELRFRQLTESDIWKVKERLREPHVELMCLPGGEYEVQVRCRSHNSNLWSTWSSPLLLTVPPRHLSEQRYVIMVIIGIGVTTALVIGFGVISQGKRIKAFLIPPIPKPHIRGIDPMLLKKGKLDEINCHFTTLYGFKSPRHHEESLCTNSIDEEVPPPQPSPPSRRDKDTTTPESQRLLVTVSSPTSYCQTPIVYEVERPYCSGEDLGVALPAETNPVERATPTHVQPELVSFPGMDYSMVLNPAPLTPNAPPSTHDFYTCVNRVYTLSDLHPICPFTCAFLYFYFCNVVSLCCAAYRCPCLNHERFSCFTGFFFQDYGKSISEELAPNAFVYFVIFLCVLWSQQIPWEPLSGRTWRLSPL